VSNALKRRRVRDRSRGLLLLAPSTGFGGGIERMADAVEHGWQGPVLRLDLYRPREVRTPEGNLRAKLRFSRRALVAALRARPDAILLLHVNFVPLGVLLRTLVGARVGLFAIGVEVWVPLSRWRRALIRRCDWLLAISSFTADWFARCARVDRGKVTVIPLPIDQRLADAAGAQHPPAGDEGTTTMLTVSRLVPEHRFKGYLDVVRALPLVLARRPSVRWVLVGNGADLAVIRDECRARGIEHAVDLTGPVDDVTLVAQYRRADVFVLPSTADPEASPPTGEGFGLVFAEAGAFGVPSIGSSRGGGSLEIVLDGATGLTVPPDDTAALASAILRLVDDADLRDRLGRAARKIVEERHLPAHFAIALSRACCDAGQRRGAGASAGADALHDHEMP
jgi:phosphatidylinositol alpha-1,6-mannosyltransferase